MKQHIDGTAPMAGLFTLPLRWVIGWTYFSAFWRRLVLENKLIPDEAGYIGEKFNHFLPNALGIKPVIEYLVSNPEALQVSMVVFTVVEAVVGLCMMLGLFTRLMAVGVFFLAMGILLGSGWLGTTCLDEWQIGVLGVAGGFVLFLTGSGTYSLDRYFMQKQRRFTTTRWFAFLGSGTLPVKNITPKVLAMSLLIFGLTLFTNQYFHGGVFGTLHNKSVRPTVDISNIRYDGSRLFFQIFRVEGADVYGSFLIGIQVLDEKGKVVRSLGQKELASFSNDKIKNHYVAKINPGPYSLIVPLGAKADISIDLEDVIPKENYSLKLVDISGIEWTAKIK